MSLDYASHLMWWSSVCVWRCLIYILIFVGLLWQSVAYDRSSAPKHCQVYGYLQGKQGLETSPVELEKKFLLTDFTYDLDKSNAQTFNVLEEVRSSIIDTVIFEFKSNHGSPVFTCIYRVRVHGHEPKSVPVVPIESWACSWIICLVGCSSSQSFPM